MIRTVTLAAGVAMRITRPLEVNALRKGLVLLLAALMSAVVGSSAQSQTRANIWLGDSSYNVCKRRVSADFHTCLRTRAINNPGARYASCNATWKLDMGTCWGNYKIELANRRGNSLSPRGISSGRLGTSSRKAVRKSTTTRTVKNRSASRSYKTTRSYRLTASKRKPKSAASRSGKRSPHRSGGLIRDPVPTVRRDPGRGP